METPLTKLERELSGAPLSLPGECPVSSAELEGFVPSLLPVQPFEAVLLDEALDDPLSAEMGQRVVADVVVRADMPWDTDKTQESCGYRKTLMPETRNLADTKRAKGSTVKAIVDMDKRTLAFKVNKEDTIDAEVALPAVVRPFCLISQENDIIRISVKRVESESAPPA